MKSARDEATTLRGFRVASGVSLESVATELGLTQRHVRKLETGASPMKRLHAVGFAYAYDETVERILSLEPAL